MKRRSRLTRRTGLKPTPLRSRTRLRSTTGLTRSGPPRPVSDKRRAEQRQRRKAMIEAFGPDPDCAIRWDERCRGKADDAHEPGMRSRGADATDPEQAVPACRPCHDSVHANPAEATERGWLIPSWRQGDKDV